MRGSSSKRTPWSGLPYEALYFIAALSTAASLSACGARTGLSFDEDLAPAGPGDACLILQGELFLTSARDTPLGEEVTAVDLYPSNGDGTFGVPLKIDIKEPFAGALVDDFDGDGSLEIHLWGLSSGVERLDVVPWDRR